MGTHNFQQQTHRKLQRTSKVFILISLPLLLKHCWPVLNCTRITKCDWGIWWSTASKSLVERRVISHINARSTVYSHFLQTSYKHTPNQRVSLHSAVTHSSYVLDSEHRVKKRAKTKTFINTDHIHRL